MSTYKPGQWNAICDRCGFKFKSDELQKDWQGLMVCKDDFETRHPQTYIKVTTEKAFPEWTRPRPEDIFLGSSCFIWDRSGYAGLGSAGCMVVGNTQFDYAWLASLKR